MSEQQQRHTYEAVTLTQDEVDEINRIRAIFDEMEKKQPDFLDAAGKSVIERIATFLTVLFGVTAFGSTFPPAYLKGNMWDKYLVIAILICYLVAMGMAFIAIQPRSYHRYRYEAQKMAAELQRIITYKKRWVRWAGILFGLGTIALAWLIVSIIWAV